MRPVLLLAAGGLAREALAVLRLLDRPVVGVLDDEVSLHGTSVGGVGVLGPLEAAVGFRSAELVLCAGRGAARKAMADRLLRWGIENDRFTNVVDPSVHVPLGCTVGAGSILLAGTVLTADVTVGHHVVLMPRVVLTHDDVVEDFATLCAGVTLGGNVRVEAGAYLGMSASVRQHASVGAGAVLGMGSVLLNDLSPGETWAGVPARPLHVGKLTTSDHRPPVAASAGAPHHPIVESVVS